MPKFTKKQILDAAEVLNVNMDVVPFETLKIGLKIELEHGLIDKRTNVTDDNIISTMKIVLAHLKEGLTYYDLLLKLEDKLDTIRRRNGHPKIFLK